MESRLGRNEGLALGALVFLGLVLRVVFVLDMEAHPAHQVSVMDPAFHVDWARAIASGEEYAPLAGRPFFRAPLYAWFLAGIFTVFGDDLLVARLVQCLLGAASIALVFAVGRRALGTHTALTAAAIAATYWLLIYVDGELLSETLVVPLVLLALWLSLGLAHGPTGARAFAAGLAWGIAALARPNVLLFVPLVPGWLLWRRRPRPLRGLAAGCLFGLGVLAPILPVAAYNTFVQGDFVLIGSYGGINFWIGNNPQADGTSALFPGARPGWWEGYYDAIAIAERDEGRSLAASEVSQHFFRRAWHFIRTQPGESLGLFGRKFLAFWAGEYGNNEPEVFVANRFSWVPRVSIGYALLAPLCLLGAIIARRDASRLFPLYGFFAAYAGSLVLFFVSSRYRVPVLPVMMIFAGHALMTLWRWARAGNWAQLVPSLILLIAFCGWASTRGPDRASVEAQGHLLLASVETERGEHARAATHLERVLEIQPRNAWALTSLAWAERSLGNVDAAIGHYAEAVGLRPLHPYALEGLLDLALAEGRTADAERWIARYLTQLEESGVETPPETPFYYLGRIRAESGRRVGARRAFARALASDPHSFRAALALGELETGAGHWEAAGQAYERALFALRPRLSSKRDDRAYAGLLRALEAQGRGAERCRHALEWSERRPRSAAAADARRRHCP